MSQIRAFFAVNLPLALVEKVRAAQNQLRERAREAGMKVAWVPPANLHVTLKFLGDVPEESVWPMRDLLLPRLGVRVSVPLTVKGAGAFPDAERPRVLWVGIETEADGLVALAREIDSGLAELGFPEEKRPFHPHLTLGRVKHGAPGPGDLFADLRDQIFGECTVHEVVLYQSVLERTGAEYTPLVRLPLAAAPAHGAERAAPAKAD